MAQLTLTYHKATAQYFTEDLGDNIGLDMVLIPGGTFLMGSPKDELERRKTEGPQHKVTVPTFFMGRFPITQAQWRTVAQLEQVDHRRLDSAPSHFKSNSRPVERIDWYEATEFCARLSQLTRRDYRLPSEAEWEYACRAGTTTPFHFGETITTDLANYQGVDDDTVGWKGSYGRGPKGIYRSKTTEVGNFPPNAFGLYDMHGNTWEWCQDHWHDNYKDAPADGRAWLLPDDRKIAYSHRRVLRGGSWFDIPRDCRSAYRYGLPSDNPNDIIGFRVVCSTAKTLL